MKTPLEYKTFETVPANTVIFVSSCMDCPFHDTDTEELDVCVHPEVDLDPRSPNEWHARYFENRDDIQPFCPMLSRVKTTIVQMRGDLYQEPTP